MSETGGLAKKSKPVCFHERIFSTSSCAISPFFLNIQKTRASKSSRTVFRTDWGVQGGMPSNPAVPDHHFSEGMPADISHRFASMDKLRFYTPLGTPAFRPRNKL